MGNGAGGLSPPAPPPEYRVPAFGDGFQAIHLGSEGGSPQATMRALVHIWTPDTGLWLFWRFQNRPIFERTGTHKEAPAM